MFIWNFEFFKTRFSIAKLKALLMSNLGAIDGPENEVHLAFRPH